MFFTTYLFSVTYVLVFNKGVDLRTIFDHIHPRTK